MAKSYFFSLNYLNKVFFNQIQYADGIPHVDGEMEARRNWHLRAAFRK
jgi:hypothetical protein